LYLYAHLLNTPKLMMKRNPRTRSYVPAILWMILVAAACTSQPENDKRRKPATESNLGFAESLHKCLNPVDTVDKARLVTISDNLRYVYQVNEYVPVWLTGDNKPGQNVDRLLQELQDLQWDGISPGRYGLAQLQKLKDNVAKTEDMSAAIALDTGLTHSYLQASHDLLIGIVTPKKADSLWYHANDSNWNAPHVLATSKAYVPLDAYRSKVPTYAVLREEYKRYHEFAGDSAYLSDIRALKDSGRSDSSRKQIALGLINKILPWVKPVANDSMTSNAQLLVAYQSYINTKASAKLDSATLHGLETPPDTILAKLGANMERVRWMQQQFGDLYVLVDVPLMELFFRKHDTNAMHMRVVVGKPQRQTPSLNGTMANVIINPQWGVPPTILKKDVLPGLEKSSRYLAKKGLKAYDSRGNVVDPNLINGANYKRYTYRQAPGDGNALGYVKFNFPNPWDIYMHDTPHRGDFVKAFRALSSGCIRLQQPQQMAVYILSSIEKMRFTQGTLDSMIHTHKTRWEILKQKIPVHITYLTAFEDTTGNHIRLLQDIYHRDARLMALLGK
jgi:L,D-transpeptidase YcbB